MSNMSDFGGIYKKSRMYLMKTNAIFIAVIALIEIGVFSVLDQPLSMNSTRERYIIMHILIPFVCMFLVVLCATILLRYWKVREQVKNSIPIVTMTIICFVLSVIHNNFPELLSSFSIPILITVSYCNQTMSKIIFLFSLLAQQAAIILLSRDSNIEDTHLLHKAMISGMILVMAYISVRILINFENQKKKLLSESIQKQSELEEELMIDGLTSLYNHRAFEELLRQCVEDASMEGHQILLAVIDIDDFKLINDDYGHEHGNIVLSRLGKIIRDSCGVEGTPARYGGEEFAVIFKDLEPFYAIDRMKKILHTFHGIKFVKLNGQKVSFSCGIVSYQKGETPHEFFHRADKAMYEAKKQGKNCVIYER